MKVLVQRSELGLAVLSMYRSGRNDATVGDPATAETDAKAAAVANAATQFVIFMLTLASAETPFRRPIRRGRPAENNFDTFCVGLLTRIRNYVRAPAHRKPAAPDLVPVPSGSDSILFTGYSRSREAQSPHRQIEPCPTGPGHKRNARSTAGAVRRIGLSCDHIGDFTRNRWLSCPNSRVSV